ncbi:hypothetical protein BXZ70DRAFT_974726 [Cristinia sonorae]|uniref:Uncharacterized protein n=1 Tax=Cristinia sonorae TaxID=1940300 RepID=A0A8K0XNY9_9AGAR|nr:hypothetical protein BXZ70DRAFT_974726 [Cristinia sonorae]
MFSLAEALVISASVSAVLLGISLLMFILTGWFLYKNRRTRCTNWSIIVAGFTLFVLSTANFGNNIQHLRKGLVTVGPNLPGGPDRFFVNIAQPTFVIKSTLYNVQTLLLDGILIYRAYIAWRRLIIVLLPLLSWLGLLTAAIGNNITVSTPSDLSDDVFAARTGRWIAAFYSGTLVTNLIATGLLAYRIWSVSRPARIHCPGHHSQLDFIFRVVIESGAIYSATVIASFICFLVSTPGVFVTVDILIPTINIVFSMIIVRVGIASDSGLAATPTHSHMETLEFAGDHPDVRSAPPIRNHPTQATRGVERTHYLDICAKDQGLSPYITEGDSKVPPTMMDVTHKAIPT